MRQSHTDRVYDQLLLTLVRSGDRRAAERLAARWQPRLFRTARRLLRDEDQARDAVQETWAGICRGWLGLTDPAKFPAWAFGILHHKCADRIQLEMRRRSRTGTSGPADEPSVAARAETLTALDQAFALLSIDHRSAAILFFGEGLSLAEVAHASGIPLGTAKSRIFHARQILKAALSGDDT